MLVPLRSIRRWFRLLAQIELDVRSGVIRARIWRCKRIPMVMLGDAVVGDVDGGVMIIGVDF